MSHQVPASRTNWCLHPKRNGSKVSGKSQLSLQTMGRWSELRYSKSNLGGTGRYLIGKAVMLSWLIESAAKPLGWGEWEPAAPRLNIRERHFPCISAVASDNVTVLSLICMILSCRSNWWCEWNKQDRRNDAIISTWYHHYVAIHERCLP